MVLRFTTSAKSPASSASFVARILSFRLKSIRHFAQALVVGNILLLKYSLPLAVLLVSTFVDVGVAQVVQAVRPFSIQGKVTKVVRNGVLVEDRSGRAWQLRLPADNGVVALSNRQKFQAAKPVVEISGDLRPSSLDKGAPVRVECYVDDNGRVREPVAEIKWLDKNGFKAGTKLNRKNKNDRGEQLCLVLGTVDRVDPDGFMVKVPKSRLASNGTWPFRSTNRQK